MIDVDTESLPQGDSDPGRFQVRSMVLLDDFSHCREGVRLAPHKKIARADSSRFQRLTGSCRKPPNAEDD
jgi:hypothetical protein